MKIKKSSLYFVAVIIIIIVGAILIKERNITKKAIMVTSPKIVTLKNGDTYNLTPQHVSKNINGVWVDMFGYNGSIPGPLIRVKEGSKATVRFTNNVDIPTTLHSHGLRLDNRFDGVPDVTQKAIDPGKLFTYELKFPDIGVFWYHPHVREDYAQDLGLYGNYIVEPNDPDYWSPVNEEIPLFLDDILMDGKGIEPFNKTVVNYALMGKYGNIMLINGETYHKQKVTTGEVVRFYLTNSANTRVFNLQIPGAKIKLAGADNGRYENETYVNSILISPSERAVIDVFFEKQGTYPLVHKTPDRTYPLGGFDVQDGKIASSYIKEFLTERKNPDFQAFRENIQTYVSQPPDKILNLSVEMAGGMHDGHIMARDKKIEWENSMGMMNAMSNSKMVKWKFTDMETQKSNMDIHWEFKKGDMIKLRLFNDANAHVQHHMQHPIHIHGQRFLILSTNGIPNTNLVWKDTTLVQSGDAVDILVEMSNPGDWMVHCHIPEHMESGMMLKFNVTN